MQENLGIGSELSKDWKSMSGLNTKPPGNHIVIVHNPSSLTLQQIVIEHSISDSADMNVEVIDSQSKIVKTVEVCRKVSKSKSDGKMVL